MDPDTWFAALAGALPDAGPSPMATDEECDALLELARVAAHTSERWTAPVTTFVAGIALARATRQKRAVRLRAPVATLSLRLNLGRLR